MAEEFISAFQDLRKEDSNDEKSVDFVRSYYDNSLISFEFCSTLQRRLNTANDNGPPLPFSHNFFSDDLSRLISDHFMMLDTLKPISDDLIKELNSINLFRKVLIDHFNNDLKFVGKIIY